MDMASFTTEVAGRLSRDFPDFLFLGHPEHGKIEVSGPMPELGLLDIAPLYEGVASGRITLDLTVRQIGQSLAKGLFSRSADMPNEITVSLRPDGGEPKFFAGFPQDVERFDPFDQGGVPGGALDGEDPIDALGRALAAFQRQFGGDDEGPQREPMKWEIERSTDGVEYFEVADTLLPLLLPPNPKEEWFHPRKRPIRRPSSTGIDLGVGLNGTVYVAPVDADLAERFGEERVYQQSLQNLQEFCQNKEHGPCEGCTSWSRTQPGERLFVWHGPDAFAPSRLLLPDLLQEQSQTNSDVPLLFLFAPSKDTLVGVRPASYAAGGLRNENAIGIRDGLARISQRVSRRLGKYPDAMFLPQRFFQHDARTGVLSSVDIPREFFRRELPARYSFLEDDK